MKSKTVGASSVDQYIATFPEEIQMMLQTLRATITACAPGVEEKISYQIPAFTLQGNLVHFAAWKNYIGFYPGSSANVVKEFEQELSIYLGAKASVRFPIEKPLPLELIRKIVKFRVAENLKNAEIKSSKRGKSGKN